jgi:hypothetical protein
MAYTPNKANSTPAALAAAQHHAVVYGTAVATNRPLQPFLVREQYSVNPESSFAEAKHNYTAAERRHNAIADAFLAGYEEVQETPRTATELTTTDASGIWLGLATHHALFAAHASDAPACNLRRWENTNTPQKAHHKAKHRKPANRAYQKAYQKAYYAAKKAAKAAGE